MKPILLARRKDAKCDPSDHTCTVCGLPWPDTKETLERHVCPPGFRTVSAKPKPINPPRALTLHDLTALDHLSDGQLLRRDAQLDLTNALNDMVPSLNGFDQLPYLPGDLILCKLNIVKLKKPRRNPWFNPRAAVCPCDARAAKANGTPL